MERKEILDAIVENKVRGLSSSYFLKPNIEEYDLQNFDDQSYVNGEIEAEFIEAEVLKDILKKIPETLIGDGNFILSLIDECKVHFFEDDDIGIKFNLLISTPLSEDEEYEDEYRYESFETNSIPAIVELILGYTHKKLFSDSSFILGLLERLKVRIGPLDYSEMEIVKDWSTSVSDYSLEFIDFELLKEVLERVDPELSRDEAFSLKLLEVCMSRSRQETFYEEYDFPDKVLYKKTLSV